MEGDGFLNGFGWVLSVILIVSLLSFGFDSAVHRRR